MRVHPAKSTAENVANIKRQINDIVSVHDWDMEVNTTDPNFYKWTQWIFVKMFKEGLAYEKEFPINWSPSCKTGLANEEVVHGQPLRMLWYSRNQEKSKTVDVKNDCLCIMSVK